MHWDPVLAVMSARFSCTANVLCIAALLALAARKEMFLPVMMQEGEGEGEVVRRRGIRQEKKKEMERMKEIEE